MTNLREKIKEILKNYHCWHTPLDCQGCDKVEPCNEETVQAAEQILQAVDEVLPPKRKKANEELGYERYYYKGFNSCLAQIRERIVEEIR